LSQQSQFLGLHLGFVLLVDFENVEGDPVEICVFPEIFVVRNDKRNLTWSQFLLLPPPKLIRDE
jgi:hypothetical protein